MNGRLKGLGIVLVAIGFAFIAGGGYAFMKVCKDGAKSLATFSAAQNVTLTYNDQGQLVDRGETAGAQAIMTLLTDEWGLSSQRVRRVMIACAPAVSPRSASGPSFYVGPRNELSLH